MRNALHVLTVHYNTPELTSELVRGFPKSTPPGRSVLMHVLDNGSTAENLHILRTNIEGLPGVNLVASAENLGFGEGMNLLARNDVIDDSDVIWLLNPDTRLDAGCLEQLEGELELNHFAVVSPLIYSGGENDSWIWYCGGSIGTPEVRVQHLLYGRQLADAPPSPFETEFISGAAPMMRASTFRTIGGFPSNYFLYWEDTFFSWRVREMGLRLGVVPTALLWHAVGASSGYSQSRIYYYWAARNRFTFADDIGVPRRRLIVGRGGLETLRPIAKALLERRGRWSKSRAAVRGTVEGLRRTPLPS